MSIEPITHGGSPPWPNENNWLDIVDTHNELVDAGKFTAKYVSSASWGITLVMICAVIGKAIPKEYRLKKRECGIRDHPSYVEDYAEAVCRGGRPLAEKGGRIEKQVKPIAEELGASVQVICEGLLKALKSGKIDSVPSSDGDSPSKPTPSNPTREDIELAETQLRKNTDEIIDMENVLDQVEINSKNAGKSLKGNWRDVTRRHIPIWFEKKGGDKK